MPIPPSELNRLLEAATGDRALEPEFFKALLEATVHAHCPSADRSGQIRFVQFHGPDGELLLPFFSDLGKARAAAAPNVRIVSLPGRKFLESTLGACLVLNPNNQWCKLYPEEVQQLLKTGRLAVLETVEFGGRQVSVRLPGALPDGLLEYLGQFLPRLQPLESAYLVEMAPAENLDEVEVVIVLVSPAAESERIVRAVVTELQLNVPAPATPISVMAIDSDHPLPGWLQMPGLAPTYRRGPEGRV